VGQNPSALLGQNSIAEPHFDALQSARRNQATEEFRNSYAARAGIEGTHAQAIRRCGVRRCRYVGLAKTRLQHVITAVALNLIRVAEWHNDTHSAHTRISRFAALQVVA
jgi:transposase